jgi:caa(3)-type oxidase subunit IV
MSGTHHPNYVRIWATLCVLLLISIAGPFVGSVTGLFVITLITAFGIAFVKAYLVAKNFMHLDVERPIVWYALGTALVFMVLFFGAVSPDVMNHEGSRWRNVAAEAETERAVKEAEEEAAHGGHGASEAGHAPAEGTATEHH